MLGSCYVFSGDDVDVDSDESQKRRKVRPDQTHDAPEKRRAAMSVCSFLSRTTARTKATTCDSGLVAPNPTYVHKLNRRKTMQADRCFYCGKEPQEGHWHFDHKIPKVQGGDKLGASNDIPIGQHR